MNAEKKLNLLNAFFWAACIVLLLRGYILWAILLAFLGWYIIFGAKKLNNF